MSLNNLQTSSPWLSFGGIPAPLAGLFGMVGSRRQRRQPNGRLGLRPAGRCCPSNLKPPPGVHPTNEAGFGYATMPPPRRRTCVPRRSTPGIWRRAEIRVAGSATERSPRSSAGRACSPAGACRTWTAPPGTTRCASRSTRARSATVSPNPAQSVLDVHSTDASKLPKRLRIYAFGAALGGPNVLAAAQALADRPGSRTGT